MCANIQEVRVHSDRSLLEQIALDNVGAFEVLVTRYEERVHRFILRWVRDEQLAEEIVQDIFIKIWEQRTKMSDIKSLSAWLYTASKNRALNSLQESLARRARETYYAQAREWHIDGNETIMEKDLQHLLSSCENHLPPRCREVFLLKKEKGLSNDEIGAHLNISTHTVKNQLKKSYAILRKLLSEHAYTFFLFMLLK